MDYFSNWKVLINDAGRNFMGQGSKNVENRDKAQVVLRYSEMTAGQVVRDLRKQGVVNYRMEKE